MQAVMLVAGKSTRTSPLTLTRPKPLLPILNRPLIYYNLDQLVGLVDEVILIVGYRKEMIQTMLGSEYRGIKIIYQEQKEQRGTGHAALQAAPHVQDRFILMGGDDIFAREDIEKLLSYAFGILAIEVDNPSQYGVMETNEEGHLINHVEKPKTNIGNLVNIGCYSAEPALFEALTQLEPSERDEIELPAAFVKVAKHTPVQVISLTGYWLPTGFPWDLLKTQRYLFDHQWEGAMRGTIEPGAMLHGNVHVGEGSVIRSGAQILGPVNIGKNCEIGSLSYIGPYTNIGDETQVGADCVIENSLVMNNCMIETGSTVRYSVIGSKVSIGEGCHLISQLPDKNSIQSYVKNKWIDTHLSQLGATLADNVKLGAKTLIYPGCKLWPEIVTSIGAIVENDLIQE